MADNKLTRKGEAISDEIKKKICKITGEERGEEEDEIINIFPIMSIIEMSDIENRIATAEFAKKIVIIYLITIDSFFKTLN